MYQLTRAKKFKLNMLTAVFKQGITVLAGLILPRFILLVYGSEVNGLISSITQFLGFISLLEMGIGPVVQSNLYKPLADKDNVTISKIYVSTTKFFRTIGYIFTIYVIVLLIIYPRVIKSKFDYWFTGSLILIISAGIFAEYFIGISYQLILNADQMAWVQMLIQSVCVILNTLISIVLIINECDIRVVKVVSACIYIARPILLSIYVNKHYQLDKHITYNEEPINQKWNGFTQHLASVVNSRTDVAVLTLLNSLTSVSIYSTYFMVVSGVEQVVMTSMNGLESMWGNMLAKKEYVDLQQSFSFLETCIHLLVTILFSTTAVMITPFIMVYTKGISDADYYAPVFGIILATAYAMECYRIPYFRMIKAAGHYKQTQWASLIQPLINIIISIVAVLQWGLVGVAIGTLVAMTYHTVYFAVYLRKNIIHRKIKYFILHVLTDIISLLIILAVSTVVIKDVHESDILSWLVDALIIFAFSVISSFVSSWIFFPNDVMRIIKKFNFKCKVK